MSPAIRNRARRALIGLAVGNAFGTYARVHRPRRAAAALRNDRTRPFHLLSAASWRNQPREKIRSSGHIVHTLEPALRAVDQTAAFEAAAVLAVNLAGAPYSVNAIPPRWLAPLAWRKRIFAMADTLLEPQ